MQRRQWIYSVALALVVMIAECANASSANEKFDSVSVVYFFKRGGLYHIFGISDCEIIYDRRSNSNNLETLRQYLATKKKECINLDEAMCDDNHCAFGLTMEELNSAVFHLSICVIGDPYDDCRNLIEQLYLLDISPRQHRYIMFGERRNCSNDKIRCFINLIPTDTGYQKAKLVKEISSDLFDRLLGFRKEMERQKTYNIKLEMLGLTRCELNRSKGIESLDGARGHFSPFDSLYVGEDVNIASGNIVFRGIPSNVSFHRMKYVELDVDNSQNQRQKIRISIDPWAVLRDHKLVVDDYSLSVLPGEILDRADKRVNKYNIGPFDKKHYSLDAIMKYRIHGILIEAISGIVKSGIPLLNIYVRGHASDDRSAADFEYSRLRADTVTAWMREIIHRFYSEYEDRIELISVGMGADKNERVVEVIHDAPPT